MLIEQIHTTSNGVRGTNRASGDPVKGPHNAPKIVTVGHKAGVVGNVLLKGAAYVGDKNTPSSRGSRRA